MGQFKNAQDFINYLVPYAKKGYTDYGVFASVTIGQALVEAGWQMSQPSGYNDLNIFGIQWPGPKNPKLNITQGTVVGDGAGKGKVVYRHYQSIADSVEDHGYFLKNCSIYSAVFSAKTPEDQAKAIAEGGWAEVGSYDVAIIQQINQNSLKQYDTGSYTGAPSANYQQTMTIESTNYEVVSGSQKQGQILYGRRYRVTISDAQGNGVDVSQLRCVFQVKKTIQMEPNFSQITIYNLNAQTENMIMLSSTRVTLEAGYEGEQYGLIFDGDIIQTIRDKEDSTTYRLTIIALDSDRAINFELANYSILRGQTARTIVDHIVNQAKYPISIGSISSTLDNAPKLTRGKVFFGKSSDYLRQIAESNGCKYYMDNGQLNMVKMDDLPEDEIFDLSPSSGLIGTPEQSDYGISGQCLLNPAIKVNSLIHIDNSLVRAKQISIGGSNNTVPSASNTGSSTNSTRQKIIDEAKKICDDPNVQYSMPYRGQTIGGITYWDCSSFAKHCYEAAGLSIVDITGPQYNQVANEGGKFVSQSEAVPGDLVFWGKGSACYHIAIYAGNGYVYAARGRDGKAPADQVAYHALYGSPEFGRPKSLIDTDNGSPPSVSGNTTTDSNVQTSPFRSLDGDGIYRCIACTYSGDTRSDDWSVSFETITQVGGQIPIVTN